MVNNSKIYLKTELRPLVVNEKTGKQVYLIFNSSAIEGERRVDLGSVSFLKNQIKMVVVKPDTEEEQRYRIKKMFVIYSPSRNSVWLGERKSPNFETREQAESEIDFCSDFGKIKHDWIVNEVTVRE